MNKVLNKFNRNVVGLSVLPLSIMAMPVQAADAVDLEVGGFIRADAGFGDRYDDELGDDRFAISRAALSVTASYENVKGVFVIGTEPDSAGSDGDVDIKDAYIVLNCSCDFSVSLGQQPLLFGLKPNGYPGDRSLNPSVEYLVGPLSNGGGVSGQAALSAIGDYRFNDVVNVRFGAFDQTIETDDDIEGSSISDNLFVQLTLNDRKGSGLYGNIGYETSYADEDESFTTITLGAGYSNDLVDASVEVFNIDAGLNGFDDVTIIVAELTVEVDESNSVYIDYSNADDDDFEIDTYRLGLNHSMNKYTTLSAELSRDELDIGFADAEVDSIDFRVTFSY
ncbi:MAG: hypothetical protein COB04_16370 [Gammaproteobacteria bacterium]|nr:MAG: hypothetical protein COB04_16370 [Gammaproteobacteria bacterium]